MADRDMAIDPSGGLAKLLANPRVDRALRRDILAVVQSPKTKRRDKLEKSVEKRLMERGVEPTA